MSPLQLLTLVIPTQNSPTMLNRTVSYLARVRFDGRILILDSSDGVVRQKNLTVVTQHGANLDIGLLHFEKSYLQKCLTGMRRVATPYSLLCADDAFVFSESLVKLVTFLERNSGHSAACGISVRMSHEPEGKCYSLPGRPILSDSPVVRFRDFAGNSFPLLHAVQRTDSLTQTFEIAAEATSYEAAPTLTDVVLNQMPVLLGRIHFVPVAAHVHVARNSMVPHLATLADPNRCATYYQRFRECLAEQLEIAGATVDHAFIMVDRYYGHLWDGGVRAAMRRLSIPAKGKREVIRHYRQLANLIRSDHLLQRRRLRSSDLVGQKPEWRLVQQLIAELRSEPTVVGPTEHRRAA